MKMESERDGNYLKLRIGYFRKCKGNSSSNEGEYT